MTSKSPPLSGFFHLLRWAEFAEASGLTTMRIVLLVLPWCLLAAVAASAQEHGRIKRKPPTNLEADRIASEMVMNDNLLQRGDIVATDRGFFVFRGVAADGYSNDFAPIPNPLPAPKR
jgi:hypothetical protein